VLDEAPYTEDDPLIQIERRALIDASERFQRAVAPSDEPIEQPDDSVPFDVVVHCQCMRLAIEPAEKLALLEMESVLDRARRAREIIEEQLRWAERGPSSGGDRN
jgi:hypothetical protein